MNARQAGALEVLTGAALFGLIPVFVHYSDGVGAVGIVAGRAGAAVVITAGMLMWAGRSLRIEKKKAHHYFIWSLFLTGSMLTYTLSIQLSGMAVAGTLMGLQPLAVVGCVWLFFREKITWPVIGACMSALVGVGLLSWQQGGSVAIWGIIFGLMSACFLGFNFTYHLKFLPSEHPWRLVYIQNLFQIPVLLPFLFLEPNHLTLRNGLSISAMGVICTFFAYTLIYRGSNKVPRQLIGILQLSENLLPVLAGVLLFDEQLELSSWVGVVLVLGSVVVTALPQRKNEF